MILKVIRLKYDRTLMIDGQRKKMYIDSLYELNLKLNNNNNNIFTCY